MQQTVRELLEAVDDPDHPEHPPGFDRSALHLRLLALQPVLERIAARPFVPDDDWRDTPFFGDLGTAQQDAGYRGLAPALHLRFSNFGELFTTWGFGGGCVPEHVVLELVAATERAGFRFVDDGELYDEPYSGRNPWFQGANWSQRYFSVHPDGIHAFKQERAGFAPEKHRMRPAALSVELRRDQWVKLKCGPASGKFSDR
jgi:hypothetical protein